MDIVLQQITFLAKVAKLRKCEFFFCTMLFELYCALWAQ